MARKRPDRLSSLIQRFRVEARVQSVSDVDGDEDIAEMQDFPAPNLLIVQNGRLTGVSVPLAGVDDGVPLLVFCPRGAPSDLGIADGADHPAEYVAAVVDMGGAANPIALALPDVVTVPLAATTPLRAVADILLEEALSPRCGGHAVIDRLCEIVVIRLLRHLIEAGKTEVGLVAGLAHPNLSLALVAIHDHPERPWRLEDLADIAAMSRTHFATTFRTVVGGTPGDYLSSWRLTIARTEIAKGTPLKVIAGKVGFSSSAALSRAFTRRFGVSPRQDAQAA